jgi:hypothetical protein
MPMKQTGRKVYKSMQGKQLDMDLLRQRNELTPAVGNAKVNARGDELGPGGKIIKKREDVLKDYYTSTGKMEDEIPARRVAEKDLTDDWDEPAPAKKTTTSKTTTKKVEQDWVEDSDGNFVQKGE